MKFKNEEAIQSGIDWIVNKHSSTNHTYGNFGTPYEFHLYLTSKEFDKYSDVLDGVWVKDPLVYAPLATDFKEGVYLACWGHDLIEDTRTSYNEAVKVLGRGVADIIYAVTNDKGRNRYERAGEKYYRGIAETPGATFVKLCDRLANLKYSALTRSKMMNVYQREQESFLKHIKYNEDWQRYIPMLVEIDGILSAADPVQNDV